MPTEIVTWMRERDWGTHHIYWHATRQWDLLEPQEQAQLEVAGQTRATVQEGQAGNGWEFLIMHRSYDPPLTSAVSCSDRVICWLADSSDRP